MWVVLGCAPGSDEEMVLVTYNPDARPVPVPTPMLLTDEAYLDKFKAAAEQLVGAGVCHSVRLCELSITSSTPIAPPAEPPDRAAAGYL